MSHVVTGGALIQSTFESGNFETVVFLPPAGVDPYGTLMHYWLDTSRPDRAWQHVSDRPVSTQATGPGSIIQGNLGSPGNFEVLVPERDGLAHYWHDNSNPSSGWTRSATAAPGSTGPGSLVQNRENSNLEVVVLHGLELRHHWRDASGWHPGGVITSLATGPAALIQSTYWGNLELVVLEGQNLVHYWRDESETAVMEWRFGGIITSAATGPAGFVQGSYGGGPNPNFEVVVPEGDALAHYWRDNTDGNLPWYPGGVVTHRAGPVNAATLTQSSFDANLEVLTQENGHSVYHYYRYRDDSRLPWFRGPCLQVNERDRPQADRGRPLSSKIVQLTGQWDAQQNTHAYNRTEESFGIRGTDLGASFRHRDRTYFLFGDTHWTHNQHGTMDSIAYTTNMDASQGLPLQFHLSYPQIVNASVTQDVYDVPLDGFSFADQMFVFFSTDHFRHRKVMGRSVLCRCLDNVLDFEASRSNRPLQFQYLTSVSELKFINVSVEYVGAEAIGAYHLPGRSDGLLIWGTGSYRNDNIYLAFLPLDDGRTSGNLLDSNPFPSSQLAILYFAGLRAGVPAWSAWEEDAVPLFYPAAIGELSVRWNAALNRWVCMYMSGPWDPIGLAVVLRVSPTPWGPWSRRRLVLDWLMDGLGHRTDASQRRIKDGWFIHDGDTNPPDGLGDDIIGDRQGNKGGAAYAPYQLPHHTDRTTSGATLYYLLSTWNPYQVMQMRHEITCTELHLLETPPFGPVHERTETSQHWMVAGGGP